MKKSVLILLLSVFSSITHASLNIPLPAPPPGGFYGGMKAAQELQRQDLEMQILREQLTMMRHQRAMMERQDIQNPKKYK